MSVLAGAPGVIERSDVEVLQLSTADELPAIQQLWPAFEDVVGLRGRKMFAMAHGGRYTTCTPIRDGDDSVVLGVERGVLPGGRYLRGRLRGDPPAVYALIGAAVGELEDRAGPGLDASRPVIEYYRRHDEIELWVPVLAQPSGMDSVAGEAAVDDSVSVLPTGAADW